MNFEGLYLCGLWSEIGIHLRFPTLLATRYLMNSYMALPGNRKSEHRGCEVSNWVFEFAIVSNVLWGPVSLRFMFGFSNSFAVSGSTSASTSSPYAIAVSGQPHARARAVQSY